jgi:hypothetical protein
MAIANIPVLEMRLPEKPLLRKSIIVKAPNAFILPHLSEGCHQPSARRGDALRIETTYEALSHIAAGTLPGVAILAVAGRNGSGTGLLRASGDGTYLSWRAPRSDRFGSTVVCDADGDYMLEDGNFPDKFIRVNVSVDYLVPGAGDAKIYIKDIYDNGFAAADITAAQASAGNVQVYTIGLHNDSPMDILNVKVWLGSVGLVGIIELSTDAANYYAPTFEDHADIIEFARIAAAGDETLYIRRTITAGAESDPAFLNHLEFSFEGI